MHAQAQVPTLLLDSPRYICSWKYYLVGAELHIDHKIGYRLRLGVHIQVPHFDLPPFAIVRRRSSRFRLITSDLGFGVGNCLGYL